MRLANGTLWPMPITLDVNAETAAKFPVGSKVALIDAEVHTFLLSFCRCVLPLRMYSSLMVDKPHCGDDGGEQLCAR